MKRKSTMKTKSAIPCASNCCIYLFCLFACFKLSAQTSVSGTYTGDSIWTKAKSPYTLTGVVTIQKTLTIEPGVTVNFSAKYDGGIYLDIQGTLIAKGGVGAGDSITFKGNQGDINNGSYPISGHNICGPIFIRATSSNSILQYVVVDALGFGNDSRNKDPDNENTAIIDINSNSCSVTNCTVKNTIGTGILFRSANTKTVSNNSFTDNVIALKFMNTSPVVSLNTCKNNTRLDVITALDNLDKLQNNSPLNIGLTEDIPMTKSDVMTNNNPYYELLKAITVPSGKTLTIQSGITFEFPAQYDGGRSLTINGVIKAQGAKTSYITFKGDGGAGIGAYPISGHNINGPVYINGNNSILDYVVVDGLGFGSFSRNDNTATIDINSSSCSVSNCIFQNILGTGLLYRLFNTKPVHHNNFNNITVGLKLRNLISALIDSNTFATYTRFAVITPMDNLHQFTNSHYNDRAEIGLTHDIPVGRNDTMINYNPKYTLLEPITIPIAKILTMEPGVNFYFPAQYDGGLSLDVQGSLIAKGTPDTYITFQGDAAAVANGAYPISGHNICGPVYIKTPDTAKASILQYIVVDGFGYGSYHVKDSNAALIISADSCSVYNGTFQNIAGTAIGVRNSSPAIAGTCFNGNSRGGVYSNGGKAKVFHSNFVNTGSASFGIKNSSTVITDTIDARYCWWGDPTGPNQATTNPIANGNSVSDKVQYDPWEINSPFDCSDITILPVALLSFQANKNGSIVNCYWQTSSEINTSHFIVEHSINGASFSDIGKITAAGNSSVTKSYQFADKAPSSGTNFYRLRMVDIDGKFTRSRVVQINVKINGSFTIYPNPAKDNLFMQVKREKAEKVALQITDMQGKLLHQENLQLQPGTTGVTFNTSTLAKGMYLLTIKGQNVEVKAFVKD